MTSMTLWILIFSAQYTRPATVIERFATEAQCKSAMASVDRSQLPTCLRVEAVR